MEVLLGLLIPFLGTTLGAGMVFLMKNRINNNECKGFNIDLEDVIKARNELLPSLEDETNIIMI